MEKIFLDQSKYYEPINTICRKYNIPFVYDWTFSLHNNMNLLIKVVNGMVIEMWDLKKIIKEFIEMFDKDLQETIIKTLEKWQEEGKLEGIINEALFNQKLDKKEFEEYKTLNDKTKLTIEKYEEIPKKFNIDLELRVERSGTYKTPQGSCIVDDTIIIAFIKGNKGVLAQYDINTGKLIRESEELDFIHANGIDYNPENKLIYVAATWDGEKNLNTVYRYKYEDFTFHSVIKPQGKNLSKEKNIRWVSYDKIYKKLYIGSNSDVYEVTNDLVEIENYAFDSEYNEIVNKNDVQQGGAVLNGYYFHGAHAEQSVSVFRLINGKAKFVLFNDLPETTRLYRGHFFGKELQSVSLRENGDIFITVRWGTVGNKIITYVYKGNIYRETYYDRQYYMESPVQESFIKVDVNTKESKPDGWRVPYNNIKEATINAVYGNSNRPFTILLNNGVYEDININLPNANFKIHGAYGGNTPDKIILKDVYVENTKIDFRRVTIIKDKKDHAFESKGAHITMEHDVTIDNVDGKLECFRQVNNGISMFSSTQFKNANRPIYATSGIVTGVIKKSNVTLEVGKSEGVMSNIVEK